jgi:hypothetical protein
MEIGHIMSLGYVNNICGHRYEKHILLEIHKGLMGISNELFVKRMITTAYVILTQSINKSD